jgi:hypothetical protein
MIDIIASLVGVVLSLGIGILANLIEPSIKNTVLRILGRPIEKKQETYSERILRLNEILAKSSKEVDEVIKEMARISQERAISVTKLEQQLEELTQREQEANARIQTLEKVPVEAIQYFEQVLQKGDRRSAWRDHVLFGLGVIVSTVIAIALRFVGF